MTASEPLVRNVFSLSSQANWFLQKIIAHALSSLRFCSNTRTVSELRKANDIQIRRQKTLSYIWTP